MRLTFPNDNATTNGRLLSIYPTIFELVLWFNKKMYQVKADLYQMENLHDSDDDRLVHHPISDAYMDKNWRQFC